MSHQSAAAGAKSDGRRRRSSKAKTKPPVSVERQWSEPPQYDLAVSGGQVRRGGSEGRLLRGEKESKRDHLFQFRLSGETCFIFIAKQQKGSLTILHKLLVFLLFLFSLSLYLWALKFPFLSLSLSSLGKRMRERDKSPNAPYAPSLGYSILGSSFGE